VLLGLLVTLALLGGIAAVVDRVAAHFAETAIATRLKAVTGVTQAPAVTITGWPFLTQLFAHDLTEVDVSTDNYKAGSMTLARIDLELHDAWRSSNTITARRVIGTANVDLSELQRVTGGALTLSTAADGLHIAATVQGQKMTGTATITVTGSQLHIVPRVTAPAKATLPPIDIPLPKLPWGVTVTAVAVTPSGLTLAATATNVDLQKP
jgi:hypothetical protein